MSKDKIVILKGNDFTKPIGEVSFTKDGKELINKDSVFSIAYKENEKGELGELLYISLDNDENYKKFLKKTND